MNCLPRLTWIHGLKCFFMEKAPTTMLQFSFLFSPMLSIQDRHDKYCGLDHILFCHVLCRDTQLLERSHVSGEYRFLVQHGKIANRSHDLRECDGGNSLCPGQMFYGKFFDKYSETKKLFGNPLMRRTESRFISLNAQSTSLIGSPNMRRTMRL